MTGARFSFVVTSTRARFVHVSKSPRTFGAADDGKLGAEGREHRLDALATRSNLRKKLAFHFDSTFSFSFAVSAAFSFIALSSAVLIAAFATSATDFARVASLFVEFRHF